MTELATIGYEGADIDDFIATLRAAEVSMLVDVRELPISRRKGFAKSALASSLAKEGIRYLHLKGLGDPKPGRDAARSGDFGKFLEIFTAHMTSAGAQSDLEVLKAQIGTERACLMCFERDPSQCHRTIVANTISDSMAAVVTHLEVKKGAANGVRRTRSRKSARSSEGVAACGR